MAKATKIVDHRTAAEILTQTAKLYSEIARLHGITNADELRKKTYELRESSMPDLVYLAIATTGTNYHPVPTTKQKRAYEVIVRNNMIVDLKTENGFTTLYVNVLVPRDLNSGFEIVVTNKKGLGKDAPKEILFKETFKPE